MEARESGTGEEMRSSSLNKTIGLRSNILISPAELANLAAIGMLPTGARSQAGVVKRDPKRLARAAELIKLNPNTKIRTQLSTHLLTT